MDKDRTQRYAESLGKIIQNNQKYLNETMDDFQKKCLIAASQKTAPQSIVIHVREIYKEIKNRLAEINAIQQLLKVKYRRYVHSDPAREKKIAEIEFIAKSCYSKFENVLKQAKIKAKDRVKEQPGRTERRRLPFQWFRSKENQIAFIKVLRILKELDYEPSPESVGKERRQVNVVATSDCSAHAEDRGFTLFLFKGYPVSLDVLYPRFQLREHDVIERYGADELRGILTHLRRIEPGELEGMFQRFMEIGGCQNLKCVLLNVSSHKALEGDALNLMGKTLREMNTDEIKILSI